MNTLLYTDYIEGNPSHQAHNQGREIPSMQTHDLKDARPKQATLNRNIWQDEFVPTQIKNQPGFKANQERLGKKMRSPMFNDFYYKSMDLNKRTQEYAPPEIFRPGKFVSKLAAIEHPTQAHSDSLQEFMMRECAASAKQREQKDERVANSVRAYEQEYGKNKSANVMHIDPGKTMQRSRPFSNFETQQIDESKYILKGNSSFSGSNSPFTKMYHLNKGNQHATVNNTESTVDNSGSYNNNSNNYQDNYPNRIQFDRSDFIKVKNEQQQPHHQHSHSTIPARVPQAQQVKKPSSQQPSSNNLDAGAVQQQQPSKQQQQQAYMQQQMQTQQQQAQLQQVQNQQQQAYQQQNLQNQVRNIIDNKSLPGPQSARVATEPIGSNQSAVYGSSQKADTQNDYIGKYGPFSSSIYSKKTYKPYNVVTHKRHNKYEPKYELPTNHWECYDKPRWDEYVAKKEAPRNIFREKNRNNIETNDFTTSNYEYGQLKQKYRV